MYTYEAKKVPSKDCKSQNRLMYAQKTPAFSNKLPIQRAPIPRHLIQAILSYDHGGAVTDELRQAVVAMDHTVLSHISDDVISRNALDIKSFMTGKPVRTDKVLPDQSQAYDMPPSESGGEPRSSSLGQVHGFSNVQIGLTQFDHMQVIRENSAHRTPMGEYKTDTARLDRRMARIAELTIIDTLTWLFASLSEQEKGILKEQTIRLEFVVGSMLNKQQQSAWTFNGGVHYVRIFLKSKQSVDPSSVPTLLSGKTPGLELKDFSDDEAEKYFSYIISHEMGHVLHALLHPAKFKVLSTILNTPSLETMKVPPEIRGLLDSALPGSSGYAKANIREAVAEIYTALVNGIQIPSTLYEWYLENGGISVNQNTINKAGTPVPAFIARFMNTSLPGKNHVGQPVKEAVLEISKALEAGEDILPVLRTWYISNGGHA